MTTLGVFGIILCAALVIIMTYRGWNIIIVAPICAIILMLLTQQPLVETFSKTFLGGSANFVSSMFGIYLAGAVLGEIYNVSGAAESIARSLMKTLKGKREKPSPLVAIIIIFAAGLFLAYGGVHVVALAYVLLPLAVAIMKEAGIPRFMAPGIVLGCIFTGALAMPGSPQTQNVVPMSYLGTTSNAALIPGIVAGIVVLCLNIFYLNRTAKKLNAQGVYFDGGQQEEVKKRDKYVNPWVAAIPLVVIFLLFNIFKLYVVYAIFIGSALSLVLFFPYLGGLKNIPNLLGQGATNSCVVLIAGAVMGGFGAVVSSSSAFTVISNAVVNFPGPKLFAAGIAIMIVVCVCGSGPAGLATALPMFGTAFAAAGVNLAALHRVASFAATTLDSLPTNAVYLALTKLTGITVKESYRYVFFTTVCSTTIGMFIVAILCTVFPGLA